MSSYAKPLGNAIRQARILHGYTQRGLAEQLAIDSRTILNIENYNGNPKMEVLYPLVRALEVDPWDIFYSELKNEREAFQRLHLLLNECTDEEIGILLPVIQAALAIVKSGRAGSIKGT